MTTPPRAGESSTNPTAPTAGDPTDTGASANAPAGHPPRHGWSVALAQLPDASAVMRCNKCGAAADAELTIEVPADDEGSTYVCRWVYCVDHGATAANTLTRGMRALMQSFRDNHPFIL